MLAVEAAIVVEATGQTVAFASEPSVAAAAPALTPSLSGPAEAANESSALLTARLQKRRIEVMNARTSSAQTFANPDGTLSYETSAQPRWVKKHGEWTDVDTTLVTTGNGDLTPAASESPLVLSGGGEGPLVDMTVDGKQTKLVWSTSLPKPTVKGATATYADVLASGVDLQVTATAAGGAEETLVVKNATAAADPALTDLVQTVSTSNGITATTDAGGNLTVEDSKGDAIVTSPAPVMWDSATNAADPATVTDPESTSTVSGGDNAAGRATVALARLKPPPGTRSSAQAPGSRAHRARVKSSLKDHKLHLLVDQNLLRAKSTVYPVYVDPAYVPHSETGSTLHYDQVQEAYPSTSNYDAAPGSGLAVGYQGFSSPYGIERTYYNLSLPARINGTTILSGKLNTTVTYAAASGSNSTTINAFSTGSISSTTTWSKQPAKSTSAANPNYPSPNASTTFTTTSSSPNKAVSFDVTAGMQYLANISNGNWTLGLFNSTESNSTDLVRFASNPTFTITYNSHATTSSQAISPSAVNAYNGKRYVTSLTPSLSAKVTDADGDNAQGQYEITADPAVADTTYAYTAYGKTVASGATSTLAVPAANAFPAGVHLRYRVRAFDGTDYGTWSGYTAFVMNTGLPTAPAIACTPYSQDTWTTKADGTVTCTLDTASTDGQGYSWGLDDPAAPKRIDDTVDGSGGDPLTVSITPGDGWHTLYAKTIDSGGNISATTTKYSFGVGADGAALLSPGDGDTSARRVSLTATGKTSYTGVTYQYRRGETDTWHTVPLADVTKTSDGSAVAAWPAAVANGVPAGLTWNITKSLTEDGAIDIRAAFTNGTATGYSQANTITVDRNAGTAPSDDVGPGSVNDLTGDYTLSDTDASGFGLSVTRTASSRRPTAGSDAEGQAAIFGPQWTSGTTAEITDSDWAYVRKTSATSVALVDVDGDETGFTATTTGGWKSEPGAEDLTLTGSLTGSFTLKDTEGTTTTFAKVASAATTWQVSTSYLPTDNSTTKVVSEAVTSGTSTLARPKYLIAPTTAVTASTCESTPAAKGCRMLEYVYATSTTATSTAPGDFTGRVAQIKEWATTPGASASTSTVIAQYAYDTTGQLRQTWDPRISPALKTAYGYDSAGRVTTLTPPGELPWTLTYGTAGNAATAGTGMLLAASRPNLTQGSASTPDGTTAITSVVYDVPLTGAKAPNAMGTSDVAAWGQSDVPTDATAVFPADSVPTSHTGSDLAASDYTRATVSYADASGREVNTATPGKHLTTTEYDTHGNTIRELNPSDRELALSGSGGQLAELTALDIDGLSTADRAQQLSTTSVYSADGLRETDEYGPLHQVTLASVLKAGAGGSDIPAGTTIPARSHTANSYDEGRPTDGTATVANQVTTTKSGATVSGYPADADVRTTTTAYDWVKGLPTTEVTDPSGLAITKTTSYDSQGRVIKTLQPKSSGSDAGATVTTYYAATGTGACNGRPEWADQVCSTGPAGAITGGGSNPTQLPTKTVEYDRWGNTSKVTETANSVTRTTDTTYDSAGRTTKVAISGGTGTAVPDSSTTYTADSGDVATVTTRAGTITHTYDALGREISYKDGAGNTATTAYDALGRPAKVTDSAPSTTTYTYDTAKDPRGLETSRTDSVAGTFTAAYDSDGELATEALPGGYTLNVTQDETGTETSRVYTRDSDNVVVSSDTADHSAQDQTVDETGSNGQTRARSYSYDAAGRLTRADDTAPDGSCTRRDYTFDKNTNRTALATATSAGGTDCTTTGAATTAYTYDSADRLTTSGTVYDALGRTTTQATGATIGYYANDLVRTQTSGTNRQTWTLDAAGRLAAWTTETQAADSTWSQTGSKANHYGADSDSPDWTQETASAVTRNVQGIDGDLDAVTSATGDTVLQLTDLHGDTTVQLPLDTTKSATALSYDEYGNPENDSTAARYGWLGSKQRSSETVTGATLMGVRLYDPTTGRFLSVDPIPGGNANAYEYCTGDPINCLDLDGRFGWGKWLDRAGTGLAIAGMFGCAACSAISAGISLGRGIYKVRHHDRSGWMDIAGSATFGAGKGFRYAGKFWKGRKMARYAKGARGRGRYNKRMRSRAAKANRRYHHRYTRRADGIDRWYGGATTAYGLYGEYRSHRW
ncbi:RHS repeat-associated core domain-containing protein [Streptomyces sp. NPDC008125]|uniref:RHS repeat-associated core domain-containing protein n=1 Tax=Streptomyces sp. NPDC008125 TaxID=3364811 RepID=UPI0036EFF301